MKFVIDEEQCLKHNLSLSEVLAILLIKHSECGSVYPILSKLASEEKIVSYGDPCDPCSICHITQRWDDEVSAALLEAEKSLPKADRIENLVKQMREIFPTGMKIGSSAWRGNVRELKLRMQKFFKLYGDYTDEQILEATKKYVDSFNGNYTYMRILKYFIFKSETKSHLDDEGNIVNQLEDISELANILDNPERELVSRTRLI
jgi:hypothetical protein